MDSSCLVMSFQKKPYFSLYIAPTSSAYNVAWTYFKAKKPKKLWTLKIYAFY